MLFTQDKKPEDSRAELRRKIHDQLVLSVMCCPLNQVANSIDKVTDLIMQMMGSPDGKVFGLTLEQVFHLKASYEARTGKKAEDI
jgi:hypothetical protein